ncbi:MAG: ribosome-associated translation inhibitor RaiA [Candidatus Nanopelagicales bacterium]
MDIVVRGRHLDVSQRFREHVEGKLERIDRFGIPIAHVDVEVSQELNPRQSDRAFEVELTCRGTSSVIRAEAHAQDKYAATDIALGRLEERLRRAADRKRNRRTDKVLVVPSVQPAPASAPPAPPADGADDDGTVWAEGPIVVRLKEHVSQPMSVAQAVEALELVGHDFYLFRDSESGAASVLYHRRGYNYGLLRLEGEADG